MFRSVVVERANLAVRGATVVGARLHPCAAAHGARRLGAMNAQTGGALEVVQHFNDAFNRHDVDAVMALMTGDCSFENTRPAPDGERLEGHDRIRAFWEQFFARSPQAHFDTEEIFVAGDRCVVRWVYSWVKEGKRGHVRGVDVFRVRDGRVAEKLSYVKG